MIKIQEAELTSVFPYYVKNNTDIQAISYAYRMAMQNVFRYSRWSMLYANIDELPDDVLDLLALELRAQYYEESMDIDVKRDIIKKSISWYITGGTVGAVEEMVRAVFGEGNVSEWYQFGGTPGTFRIETGEELSPDIVRRFNEIINKVKNKRAQLDKVMVNRKNQLQLRFAAHSRIQSHVIVRDNGLNNVWQDHKVIIHSRITKHVIIDDKKIM